MMGREMHLWLPNMHDDDCAIAMIVPGRGDDYTRLTDRLCERLGYSTPFTWGWSSGIPVDDAAQYMDDYDMPRLPLDGAGVVFAALRNGRWVKCTESSLVRAIQREFARHGLSVFTDEHGSD